MNFTELKNGLMLQQFFLGGKFGNCLFSNSFTNLKKSNIVTFSPLHFKHLIEANKNKNNLMSMNNGKPNSLKCWNIPGKAIFEFFYYNAIVNIFTRKSIHFVLTYSRTKLEMISPLGSWKHRTLSGVLSNEVSLNQTI